MQVLSVSTGESPGEGRSWGQPQHPPAPSRCAPPQPPVWGLHPDSEARESSHPRDLSPALSPRQQLHHPCALCLGAAFSLLGQGSSSRRRAGSWAPGHGAASRRAPALPATLASPLLCSTAAVAVWYQRCEDTLASGGPLLLGRAFCFFPPFFFFPLRFSTSFGFLNSCDLQGNHGASPPLPGVHSALVFRSLFRAETAPRFVLALKQPGCS